MGREKKIDRGGFMVARQIFDSEIFYGKPATWLKVWLYFLGNVNHSAKNGFRRGEGLFNYREMSAMYSDLKIDVIKKCVRWLKSCNMISTTKSTRGVRILINNYEDYQTIDNYRSTTKSTSKSTTKAPQKHHRSTTINNNDNNVNNDNNDIYNNITSNLSVAKTNPVNEVMGIFYEFNPMINFGNKTQRKAVDDLIGRLGFENVKAITKYAISIQGKKYAPVITTPVQLKNKLGDLRAFKEREASVVNLDNL